MGWGAGATEQGGTRQGAGLEGAPSGCDGSKLEGGLVQPAWGGGTWGLNAVAGEGSQLARLGGKPPPQTEDLRF